MELDNLKTIWKEQDIATDVDREPVELLVRLVRERSRGPIERMRRNLRIEGLLMILIYTPTIVAYLTLFNGSLSLISVVLSVFLVFFWVYYYLKYQLLKKMQCVTCEVRSNLARQVRVLSKYIRFYLWSGTFSTLTGVVIAYLVMVYSKGYKDHHFTQWWFLPPFLLMLLVPFTLGCYFLNKWYVNKLYGRHVKKLKQLLQEMDEV